MCICVCVRERKTERRGGGGGGGCVIILKVSQDTGTVSQRLRMKGRRMRKGLEGEWVDGGWTPGAGVGGGGRTCWTCESEGVSTGQGHSCESLH